jgi:hypothetical protein
MVIIKRKGFTMKYLLSVLTLLLLTACSKKNPPIKTNTISYTSSVDKAYLQSLDFKDQEIISVSIENQFYYVHKSGKKISTLTYDHKADEFEEGLARTKINGKIGFFNRNLEMILKPVYDFAFPFHKGIAEICMGCKEKQEGESSMLDGGEWKKIDRNGLIIE